MDLRGHEDETVGGIRLEMLLSSFNPLSLLNNSRYRIQSLTFAFWCFTDVLRICTNSLASLDWNTSETLTDIAFEAWQNLPHSGCNEFYASAVFVGQGLCHLSTNEISI